MLSPYIGHVCFRFVSDSWVEQPENRANYVRRVAVRSESKHAHRLPRAAAFHLGQDWIDGVSVGSGPGSSQ
jgi:hypothetical protein